MENPIKQIYKFNKEAGFLNKPINPWLEATYQIEEAMEGYNCEELSQVLFPQHYSEPYTSHKELARAILSTCKDEVVAPVDVLDKAVDAVVFAVGTMAKLGLDANGITKAINIVMHANMQKLKQATVDAEGKLTKPEDFVGPEEKLQELLDSYTSKEV